MLLGCGSLSSWVRRLVACVGYDSLPIHLAPSLARLVHARWALCCRAIAPSQVIRGDLYRIAREVDQRSRLVRMIL